MHPLRANPTSVQPSHDRPSRTAYGLDPEFALLIRSFRFWLLNDVFFYTVLRIFDELNNDFSSIPHKKVLSKLHSHP